MKSRVFPLLLLVLTLLAACGSNSTMENSKNANTNVQTSIEKSQFPGIEIETEIGEYDKFKYALHFPRTESDVINKEIQTFISQQRQHFLEVAQNVDIEESQFSELNLDFEISHLSDPFLSIVFTSTMNIPETDSTSMIYTLNFDRLNNSVLSLEDILCNENSLEYLQELSQRQLLQNDQLVELVKTDKLTDGISPKLENYKTFSLLDQSLNIYFNNSQFQSPDIESFNIALTYNTLTGIIKPSFLQSIYKVASTETELLSETIGTTEDVLTKLDPAKKYVAITFDDGPHKDYTPRILDILKKYNAKATFYVLGNRLTYYPDIVKRAYDEGHEIGNHTWSHPNLTGLTKEALIKEVNNASNEIAKIIGKTPKTIRPPYGAYDDRLKEVVSMPLILWSVDTLDWKHKNKERIKQVVQNNVTNGSIILMHDIHQASADALEDVIISLTRQGYHFVTVSELLELSDPAVAYASQVYTNK